MVTPPSHRYQSHFPHEVAGLEMIPPWFERLEDSEEATKARARRKKQKPGRLKDSFSFLGFLNRYEPGHAVTTAVLIMAMFQVGLAIVLFYGVDGRWLSSTSIKLGPNQPNCFSRPTKVYSACLSRL